MACLPPPAIDELLMEATSKFAAYICSLRTTLLGGLPAPPLPHIMLAVGCGLLLAGPATLPTRPLGSPHPGSTSSPSLPAVDGLLMDATQEFTRYIRNIRAALREGLPTPLPPTLVLPPGGSVGLPSPNGPLPVPLLIKLPSILEDFERQLDHSFNHFLAKNMPSRPPTPAPKSIKHTLPTDQPLHPDGRPAVTLKVALLNTRSLVGHSTEIADHISEHNLDILAITETWLHPAASHAALLATPDGYKILRADRDTDKVGGGVALIFRESLKIHQVTITTISGCELLLAKASTDPNTTISILVIYRPPTSMPDFEEKLLALIANISTPTTKLIIMGDFNFWAYNPADPVGVSLISALEGTGLTQHVKVPTQEKGNTLDWALTQNLTLTSLQVEDCPWSDHSVVSFELEVPARPLRLDAHPRVKRKTRNLKKITPASFAECAGPLIAELTDSPDPEVIAEQFRSITSRTLDLLAPEKWKITKTETRNKTWFGENIILARKDKRAAERAWKACKDSETKNAYKTAATAYKNAILSAKKSHYNKRISHAQSSSKELFKIVKELESPAVSTDNAVRDGKWCQGIQDALMAKIDSHRSSIASKLASTNPGSPTHCTTIPLPPATLTTPLFYFSPVSISEVTNIISGMRPTTCKGDYCPASIIKECVGTLAPLITKFINASFAAASVPASLKQAWITPLLKKPSLDPDVASNYRPITNVPFLLKILDRVAYLQVQKFLEDHHLLGARQSGFRAKHGTETALIDLKSNIANIIEKGQPALLMLLDLSAAFDLVDHDTLVARLLQHSCFSSPAASWIKSFLGQRTARVFSGPSSATPTLLKCGVPQGSCLSPTLYNTYTRPLFDLLDNLGVCYTNYADDTQLVLELTTDHAKDSLAINKIYSAIQHWMLQNSLALNDSKTELLILGTAPRLRKLSPDYQQITIAGCPIRIASHVKTLGVYLDAHMDMRTHVKHLKSSCAYICRLLRQIRPYLSEENAAHLARALVVSRLDYCNGVLAATSAGNLHDLQVIQNNALRTVRKTCPREHIAPVRRALHWLPVQHRINHKLVTLAHKCRTLDAPPYLAERLTSATAIRTTRSVAEHRLQQPRYRLQTVGAAMFDVAAPKLWNELPPRIRSIQSLDAFKREVKTFYFNLS